MELTGNSSIIMSTLDAAAASPSADDDDAAMNEAVPPPHHETKRQKTEAAAAAAAAAADVQTSVSPPKYGCKEYWEQRYAKQFQALSSKDGTTTRLHDGTTTQPQPQPSDDDGDDTTPYHSWYFTYDELRPILLPILLGGREEARILLLEQLLNNNNCAADEPSDDEEYNSEDKEQDDDGNDERAPTAFKASRARTDGVTPQEDVDAKEDETEGEDDEEGEGIDEGGEGLDEEGEGIDEDEEFDMDEGDDDDEEEEEEDEIDRDGLARDGPVSVLEIGCGDVPLGAALASELKELEDATGASSSTIVTGITCTDYSQVVVDMMRKQYFCNNNNHSRCSTSNNTHTATIVMDEKDGGKNEDGTAAAVAAVNDDKNRNDGSVPLQFVVADARELPYPDGSFGLVLEKGTLDAMLSDTETGVANCIKIVAECARVVALSGCIVLISHLNAHTASGLSWLDEVVVAGLEQQQKTTRAEVIWEIEVHGNSEIVRNNTDDDDEDDEQRVPVGSVGPAVYVIHKRAKPTGEDANGKTTIKTMIPIKFFSY